MKSIRDIVGVDVFQQPLPSQTKSIRDIANARRKVDKPTKEYATKLMEKKHEAGVFGIDYVWEDGTIINKGIDFETAFPLLAKKFPELALGIVTKPKQVVFSNREHTFEDEKEKGVEIEDVTEEEYGPTKECQIIAAGIWKKIRKDVQELEMTNVPKSHNIHPSRLGMVTLPTRC